MIIRKFKSAIRLLKMKKNWIEDSQKCKKKLYNKIMDPFIYTKIMILMPHSDDEWIGCSTLLNKYSNNIIVVNMDMLGGDNTELHLRRRQESSSLAKKMGYHFLTIQNDKINELRKLITTEKPEIIFAPCYFDWHDEHIETMNILQNAISKELSSVEIGLYQVSLPIPPQFVNCAYPMTRRELQRKWKFLKKQYHTQKFLPTRRFMLNEYINGALMNGYAAECYSIRTFDMWKEEFNKYKFDKQTKEYFLSQLQNIKIVREELDIYIENKGKISL